MLHPLRSQTHSYDAAGVSLATAGTVVERLRAAVESTGATGFGAFAGLHPLDERPLPRRVDRRRRHEARPRPRARDGCATAAPTSPRTASTTSRPAAPIR